MLSHFTVQNAKPIGKPFKLADGGGLFLGVQPNGSKLWRLRYFYLGKERSLSIGAYPAVSLADARARREEAKRQIAADTDPSIQKKLRRIAAETAARTTFCALAPTPTSSDLGANPPAALQCPSPDPGSLDEDASHGLWKTRRGP